MRTFEDKLENLDSYFASKSDSEKWLVILIVAGLIGYILYLYLYPYAESKYNYSLRTQKKLKKKIAEEQTYLHSITVNGDRTFYIKKYDRDIAKKKAQIKSYEEKIALLNRSFERLSEVLFNKENWSRFLDSITTQARDNDIHIRLLTNKYVTGKTNFGHVLEMGILCEGRFQNIMAFVNDLEQNKLVTDVYQSRIYLDPKANTIRADLNVSVWGVNR